MSPRLFLARADSGVRYLAFTWLSLRGDSSVFPLLGNTLYPQYDRPLAVALYPYGYTYG